MIHSAVITQQVSDQVAVPQQVAVPPLVGSNHSEAILSPQRSTSLGVADWFLLVPMDPPARLL